METDDEVTDAAVAAFLEAFPEPDLHLLVGRVAAYSGNEAGEVALGGHQRCEVRRFDARLAVGRPPGTDELPPLLGLGVGVPVQLVPVRHEAMDASTFEDAADDA